MIEQTEKHYVVIAKFSKGDHQKRIEEANKLLKESLLDFGSFRTIEIAHDGSFSAHLISSKLTAEHISRLLLSPSSKKGSAFSVYDKMTVLQIHGGFSDIATVTDWLKKRGL